MEVDHRRRGSDEFLSDDPKEPLPPDLRQTAARFCVSRKNRWSSPWRRPDERRNLEMHGPRLWRRTHELQEAAASCWYGRNAMTSRQMPAVARKSQNHNVFAINRRP